MKPNPVKKALREGKPQVGTWLSLGSVVAARFLARSGLPWLTVDMEHTHTDIQTAAMMFGAIADAGCVPLARISTGRHDLIKSVLDCGAMGIVAPMVMDAAEAQAIVAATKYPPKGTRSVGGGLHALNYGASAEEYYRRADDEILVVIQTEHIAAVDVADETYAVAGVDAVFVGPNDLAASLRAPDGTPPSKELMEATLTRIREAAARQGIASGLHVFSIEDGHRRLAEGWRFVAVNSELKFMVQGASDVARAFDSRPAGGEVAKYGIMAILLIGTLDTKGDELGFVRDLIRAQGLETLVVDAGSAGPPRIEPDISRVEVFRLAGVGVEDLKERGLAVARAAEGVAILARQLYDQGRVDGVFALGGSAGTVIGTSAMRALPFGIPKVMFSTQASGQTRPFVGRSDIAMFHPVLDIAGLNRLAKTGLSNAAHALVGMVRAPKFVENTERTQRVVAATMFGVTTPCVDRAREVLEAKGVEVLVFHATGSGGQAMEGLIADGLIDAVLDLTTTELADELVGGILSAGPDRLKAAIRRGVPQVVSVGALDMVNFGPRATVPDRFADRLFHQHNPSVTLMRTTAEESAELGRRIGAILTEATAEIVVMLPLGGISALDAPGMPFFDPEANAALFQAIHQTLDDHPRVTVVARRHHINDPAFALEAALALQLICPDLTPEKSIS